MLRFMDGFDGYAVQADMSPNWTTNSGQTSFIAGRYGGKAISCGNNFGSYIVFPDYQDTWIFGGSVKFSGTDFAYGFGDYFLSKRQITVQYQQSSNRLFFYRDNNVLLAVSKMYDFVNLWHHLQIKIVCHPSNGSITMRIDGQTDFSVTGINTQPWTTNTINYFQMPCGINVTAIIDDMYLFDGQGSVNNDIITNGEPRIETLIPTGTGSHIDFTPSTGAYNWATLDETTPNGDTDYNAALAVGSYDLLTNPALSELTGSVYGVQPRISAEKTNAGLRLISPIVNSNGNTYTTISGSLQASYGWLQGIVELDPSTGTLWTLSGVNNAQFGYKIIT